MKTIKKTFIILSAASILYGCALAWLGIGAGAGIVTYKYFEGGVVGQYPVPYRRAWNAVNTALSDLKISISQSTDEGTKGRIDAVRKDGKKVVVKLKDEGLKVTTISIRVGVLGDKSSAEKIHDHIVKVLGI